MSTLTSPAPAGHARLWLRAGAAIAAPPLVAAGIWVAGGVLTNDFRASMALTALWFAAVLIAAVVVWRRLPPLRAAAVVAVATLIAIGGYLGIASVRDVRVHEAVVTGPALASGTFRSLAHPASGDARVVESGGARYLTLTRFETDPGPDLYVYIVPRAGARDVDGGVRLARLKGNIGDQQFALPSTVSTAESQTVVIWCRAFSVAFGAATLERF